MRSCNSGRGAGAGLRMTMYETVEAQLKAHGFHNGYADAFDERFKHDMFGWEHHRPGHQRRADVGRPTSRCVSSWRTPTRRRTTASSRPTTTATSGSGAATSGARRRPAGCVTPVT